MNDTKAANLPEFVNVDFHHWSSIQLDFLKQLSITTIDLSKVHDGTFQGEGKLNDYHLKLVSATLEIIVIKGKIVKIDLKENQGVSEKSIEILNKIIKSQSIDLQKLNVKSSEELVLVKAVEDGLKKGISK
jgi:uncharacterized protein with FMN-binding domain